MKEKVRVRLTNVCIFGFLLTFLDNLSCVFTVLDAISREQLRKQVVSFTEFQNRCGKMIKSELTGKMKLFGAIFVKLVF